MFYEVFVTLPSNYFSLKSVGLFHPKFSRCATVFQPLDTYIIQCLKLMLYKDCASFLFRLLLKRKRTKIFHPTAKARSARGLSLSVTKSLFQDFKTKNCQESK